MSEWREHLNAIRRELVAAPGQGADMVDAGIGYALNDCEAAIAYALGEGPAPDMRLRYARDLVANYLWNEDDSGDDDQLSFAYDLLAAVLGHASEESVGQTLGALYRADQ